MISDLLYKEFRLATHPNLYVFTLLGALVIVPAYPYGMVIMFGCLGPYISFMYGRETNDIYYTTLLPVRKRDTVRSKCLLLVCTQLAQLLISLPFAVLRLYILPDGNPVGIEANVAFYGFGLMIYAVFNALFLTEFFKTAYKVGKAFVRAIIPAALMVVAMETSVNFPQLAWLDGVSAEAMAAQLPILAAGVAVYAVGMLCTYKISAKHFEKVDL